jgi:hypothetical protein
MKKLFLITILLLISSQFYGQCTWTLTNRVDCSLTASIVRYCNGQIDSIGASVSINYGTWDNPSNTRMTNQPCIVPGCTYKVRLNGTDYGIDEVFCCNPPPDCVPNNCVKVQIDSSSKLVKLVVPDGC